MSDEARDTEILFLLEAALRCGAASSFRAQQENIGVQILDSRKVIAFIKKDAQSISITFQSDFGSHTKVAYRDIPLYESFYRIYTLSLDRIVSKDVIVNDVTDILRQSLDSIGVKDKSDVENNVFEPPPQIKELNTEPGNLNGEGKSANDKGNIRFFDFVTQARHITTSDDKTQNNQLNECSDPFSGTPPPEDTGNKGTQNMAQGNKNGNQPISHTVDYSDCSQMEGEIEKTVAPMKKQYSNDYENSNSYGVEAIKHLPNKDWERLYQKLSRFNDGDP